MKKGPQALCSISIEIRTGKPAQSYDVISVDASVTSELVVVQQVDFVVNVGGHVFVEVVGRTNINIFQDIFVVVVTAIDDTCVFTFRLQVSQDGRRPKSNWY